MDLAQRLEAVERLSRLRDEGALTEAEFVDAKGRFLTARPAGEPQTTGGDAQYYVVNERDKATRLPKWAIVVGALAVVLSISGWLAARTDWGTQKVSQASLEAKDQTLSAPNQPTGVSGEESTASSLAAQADALEAEGEAVEAALEAATPAPDESPQPAIIATKAARCRVSVGNIGMNGPCTFNVFSDTEFEVTQPDADFKAQVVRQGAGNHGVIVGKDGSREDHGPLVQKGACWSNVEVEICAWAT